MFGGSARDAVGRDARGDDGGGQPVVGRATAYSSTTGTRSGPWAICCWRACSCDGTGTLDWQNVHWIRCGSDVSRARIRSWQTGQATVEYSGKGGGSGPAKQFVRQSERQIVFQIS